MFSRLAWHISRCRPMVIKGLNGAYFSVLKANYDKACRSRELNIQNDQQTGGSRVLNVTWNNDTVRRFPFLFLRDSCQCSKWYRTEFDLNVLFIHLLTRKTPFYALVFTLSSKVDLIWTRAGYSTRYSSIRTI